MVALPAAGRDSSPSSVAEQPLSHCVGDTGPKGVWDKLGTAEFSEQHGQIQEKMLPLVQNCDSGG